MRIDPKFKHYCQTFEMYKKIIEDRKEITISSPLEKAFLGYFITIYGAHSIDKHGNIKNNVNTYDSFILGITPQVEVFDELNCKNYIIDFVFTCCTVNDKIKKENESYKTDFPLNYNARLENKFFKVAVELDGYTYHEEKTPFDITYRNERDMLLSSKNFYVCHFLSNNLFDGFDKQLRKLDLFIKKIASIIRGDYNA